METPDMKPMRIVTANDTANTLAAVVSGTDATEVDPSTSSLTLACDNLTTGVVKVSLDVLNSAGFDADSWIKDQFALRYWRGISNLIYAGNAGNIAALSTYTTGITTAAVATLAYKDLVNLAASLDPAYVPNASFAVNNSTLYAISNIVDNNNRPLFLPYNDGGQAAIAGTILGHKVALATQMPNIATNAYAVLFGDFKQAYTLRIAGGAPLHTMFRLAERYAPAFEVGFVGFASAGGVATNAGNTPMVACKIQ
jgi:HK97 family phage major capsid protein